MTCFSGKHLADAACELGEELGCGRRCLLHVKPRSQIPKPDALNLNFEHVLHDSEAPLLWSLSDLQMWASCVVTLTSIHSQLSEQEGGPFPEARPGAQADSLLGSAPMGARPNAQRPSEKGPFCSGLRCVSECPEPQAAQQSCDGQGTTPPSALGP